MSRPQVIYKNFAKQLYKKDSKSNLTYWDKLKLKLWWKIHCPKVLEKATPEPDWPEGYMFSVKK